MLKENGDEDDDLNYAKSQILDKLKKIIMKLVATTVNINFIENKLKK